MAEGVPLLRVYIRNGIEGSNPSFSAIIKQGPQRGPFFMMATNDGREPSRFDKLRLGRNLNKEQSDEALEEGHYSPKAEMINPSFSAIIKQGPQRGPFFMMAANDGREP